MRSAVAIALLLTACAAEPRAFLHPSPEPYGAEKVDLYGTWSHRAVVIASETPSVVVGDETTSEIDIALEEDFVIAYGEGHEPQLALRIHAHFDVVERPLSTGEHVFVESNERPWWQRDYVRMDVSQELIGAGVPTDAVLEPMAYVDLELRHEVTCLPERDAEGRLVWTFVSAYWVDGSPPGEVLVRHELERIDP